MSLDLKPIEQARATLAQQEQAQRDAAVAYQQAKLNLGALQRSGANSATIARAESSLARLAVSASSAAAAWRQSLKAVSSAADRLAVNPATAVESLATTYPVALLPVAVQTRYDKGLSKLMIRIYPDDLHGFTHEPGLGDNEIEAGKNYWIARFAEPGNATSPWLAIAGNRPARAAYIVKMTTPTNLGQINAGVAPVFNDAAIPTSASEAPPVFARVLPTCFVAIGMRGGKEIFRKWGKTVADYLPISPVFDPLQLQESQKTDPFGDDRAWMVNYTAAESAGMAITITKSDLIGGATLAQGVERLMVLGVDWTRTPDVSAGLMASLLDNHQYGDGLSFVAQGTPTNNTGTARSGFSSDGADTASALNPAQGQAKAVADELASAGARLQLLLGIPSKPAVSSGGQPVPSFDMDQVPNADLLEGASSGHMINALWNATLGYALRFFWNPLDSSKTLIENSAIETLRAFAVRYLRPSGPLSALRVGKTPYGILPVAAGGFAAKSNSALERELLEVLGWFRFHWNKAIASVPTLKTPSAESLHQVLAMQPWAQHKRFWEVAGPAAVKNYPDIEPFAALQEIMVYALVDSLLYKQPLNLRTPFLATCAVRPKAYSLDAVPWVQRDPAQPALELDGDQPLARNFIEELLKILAPGFNRAVLTERQDGESLLEAMLAFAADEEFLQSGNALLYEHVSQSTTLSTTLKMQAKRLRPLEYVGVDVSTQIGDQIDINHAAVLLQLVLGETTQKQTIHEYISGFLGATLAQMPEHLRNIAQFKESLAFLKDRTAGELQMAFKTTLDLYAHRLDAWITALTTKRLDEMRDRAPVGAHIGAFGVVENLLPDASNSSSQAVDSLGYVHAPSLQQAATAAILRSGHLANQQAAGNPFDIDLRSQRVKGAKRLLEGLANGQSLAALLGYRFERGLRDSGNGELAQYILELRLAFPLRPAGSQASEEAQEAIAARDVIDAVRLMDTYRKGGMNEIAKAAKLPQNLSNSARTTIGRLIDDLLDQADAVSDLLLAESVFHVAGGNMDGSAAAMAALDQQERPPETRGINTPHSTRGYTQRVVVALQSDALGPWAGVADGDLAAQVEPRLNAWIAGLLGAPRNYVFGARIFTATMDPNDPAKVAGWADSGETLQVNLSELAMSPLALVLGSEAQQGSGQSAFQERVSAVLAVKARARLDANPDYETIVLDALPGKNGLVAFESFAWLIRRLLEKARALRRMDMVRVENDVEADALRDDGEFAGIDLNDLENRLALAEAPALTAMTALRGALALVPQDADEIAALDPQAATTLTMLNALENALGQAHALGWRSAITTERVSTGGAGATEVQGERVNVADTVARAADRAAALLAEIGGRLDAAPAPDLTDSTAGRAQAAINRIRAILGKSFPVLPRFTLGAYAPNAAAALNDRSTLLGGDDLAIAGWLPKLSCVRETMSLLTDVLTAAEGLGQEIKPEDLKLLQFPRQVGAKWAALPPAPDQDLRGVVAVAAHAPAALAALAPDDVLCGLFVDEWSESVPATQETTGLGFHFDAPGARPAQSILLAVPADPAAENWTLDALVDVVNEAMALARLRAVRPQDLQGLGLILPGIFLSNNFTKDVPSTDFQRMIKNSLGTLRKTFGQNSEQSFMKMASGTNTLFE